MIEKNQEAKIRSGAPKRDPVCYQVQRDIVIPKGTILRSNGNGEYVSDIGLYGKLVINENIPPATNMFKRVIAS